MGQKVKILPVSNATEIGELCVWIIFWCCRLTMGSEQFSRYSHLLQTGGSQFITSVLVRDFLFSWTSINGLVPLTLLLNGYRNSFPGVKRLGCDGDQPSPASVEVKNEWCYVSAPCMSSWYGQRQPYLFCVIIQKHKGSMKERRREVNKEKQESTSKEKSVLSL